MISEKTIQKYVDQFGEKLIQDVVNKIEENNWISSGNLLNSLEFTTETFNNMVVGNLNIAGYYQFLKDGQRKTTNTKTGGIRVPTTGVTSKAYAQTLDVPEGKVSWVTPLLEQDIKYFDERLIPEIQKDVVNIIETELNKVK